MVGQRFINCLKTTRGSRSPGSASDRFSGKLMARPPSGASIAAARAHRAHDVAAAEPEGAPKIIFAALDAAFARELEPQFAAAGCAVVSNSSAYRMAPNVPLVIPEINAEHLHLIEEQPSRQESGGYMVTNPNCSTIGLVMALKPIEERFGIEQIFVTTMQAVSGAGYPGVPSMDILGNVVPYIGSEEEKMEAETLKLLGKLEGPRRHAARRAHQRALQPRRGRRRPHRERLHQARQQAGPAGHARRDSGRLGGVSSAGRSGICPPLPISPSQWAPQPTVRSRVSIAIAATAWRSPWAACAPAACSTGSSPCSRTTPFAEPPERPS